MCRRIGKSVVFLGLGGLLCWFLLDAQVVRQAVWEGLSLCANTAIPAMFPFLVVSTLLIHLGFGQIAARRLEWVMRPVFHLGGAGATALILGFVGGYPMGGRTVAQLYQSGQLSTQEAQRLLAFSNNSNPAFLVTVLGVGVFGSERIGVCLWGIHVVSALLVGVLLRPKSTGKLPRQQISTLAVHFPTALVESVATSLGAMLSICAFVILFYVLSAPLVRFGDGWNVALVGTVELFSASALLPATSQGFLLAAALSGWGGLSVLCQTAAVLSGSGLSMTWCAMGKALQCALSALLAWLLLMLQVV